MESDRSSRGRFELQATRPYKAKAGHASLLAAVTHELHSKTDAQDRNLPVYNDILDRFDQAALVQVRHTGIEGSDTR